MALGPAYGLNGRERRAWPGGRAQAKPRQKRSTESKHPHAQSVSFLFSLEVPSLRPAEAAPLSTATTAGVLLYFIATCKGSGQILFLSPSMIIVLDSRAVVGDWGRFVD